jgi:hypothetical protein
MSAASSLCNWRALRGATSAGHRAQCNTVDFPSGGERRFCYVAPTFLGHFVRGSLRHAECEDLGLASNATPIRFATISLNDGLTMVAICLVLGAGSARAHVAHEDSDVGNRNPSFVDKDDV